MLNNCSDFLITDGTFNVTNHAHHEHQYGPSISMQITKKTGKERLLEVSAPGAFHDSGDRFDPPKCHPNIRVAVLEKLMEWFIGWAGRDMFILWLYGPAGAGKTAIAQSLAERCSATKGLLGSFFFSRTDPKRNNERSFAATLAYQAALNIPGFSDLIEAIVDKDPSIFHRSFETQFNLLFVNPLLYLASTGLFLSTPLPYLLIIDGLDECQGTVQQQKILDVISATLQQHRELPLLFLIASRPEYHLTLQFSRQSVSRMTCRLALDDTYRPDADIKLFFIDYFAKIRATHPVRSQISASWPPEDGIDKLVTKSSGQFIYAATVIRYVSSPHHKPMDRLKVILGLLPVKDDRPYAQLDTLYSNILDGVPVENIGTALRILGVIILTNENTSFSAREVEQLMFLDQDDIRLLLLDLASVVEVVDDETPIRILHASFRDFLLDQTRSQKYHVDPRQTHTGIARLCCHHIRNFHKFGFEWKLSNNILFYVFNHFDDHLNGTPDIGELGDELLNVPYIQCLPEFSEYFATILYEDDGTGDAKGGLYLLSLFLDSLRNSNVLDTRNLYLRHRGIYDRMICQRLSDFPDDLGRALCLVYVDIFRDGSCNPLQLMWELLPLETRDKAILDAVYVYYLVDAESAADAIELFNGPVDDNRNALLELLTDPCRAGPYTLDDSKYTTVTEALVQFIFRPWDNTRYPMPPNQFYWNQFWEAIPAVIAKAGHSQGLLKILGRHNLRIALGKPRTNVTNLLKPLVKALGEYLKKFNGLIPPEFHLTIDRKNWHSKYDILRSMDDDLDEEIDSEVHYSDN